MAQARQTLRPKAGNPNVLEVFAEEEQAFADVIQAAVTPDYRPPGVRAVRRNDDDYINDEEDPSSSAAAAATAQPAAKKQRAQLDADALTGTPLDPFNMDALRRYTERQIILLHEPVVEFAATVAYKASVDPKRMLLNDGGDLLDAQAGSVRSMLLAADKTLGEALLLPALVIATAELLKTIPSSVVKVEVPPVVQPEEAVVNVPPFSSPSSPTVVVKLEPEKPGSDPVKKVEGRIWELIGPPNPGAGAPAAAAAAVSGPQRVLRELADIFAQSRESNSMARWQWNRKPENLSMAIITPALREAMRVAHMQVAATIPGVLMWHLITGAHVRGDFAELVSCHLNRAPGELQYPHYNGTRGGGVITGTRISSGKWSHELASQGIAHQLRWFRSVYYGPAQAWLDLQKRGPEAATALQQAERTLTTALDECRTRVNILWTALISTAPYAGYMVIAPNAIQTAIRSLVALQDQLRKTPAPTAQQTKDVADAKTAFLQAWNRGLPRLLGLESLQVWRLKGVLDTADEDALNATLDSFIQGMSASLEKTRVFRDDALDMSAVYDALEAATAFRTAIGQLALARKVRVETLKDLRAFPEEDKVELFRRPDSSAAAAANVEAFGWPEDGRYRDYRLYQYAASGGGSSY